MTAGPGGHRAHAHGGSGESPEEEAARLRHELLAANVGDLVANHAYGLFELARIYLGADPPRLADASLVIDALAGLLEGVQDRLGEQGALLQQGLRQVQLAFVQLSDLAARTPADAAPAADESSAPNGT